MPNFTITTLGCKTNHYESEAIARQLRASGWILVNHPEKADLCVINTCTVTGKASMQSRQMIRRSIRSNPKAGIIVTGCYAQTEPNEIKKIRGVRYILGHAKKHKIPEIVLSLNEIKNTDPILIRPELSDEHILKQFPVTVFGSRTRPYLKIQDGCDAFCTYCIVPYARGRSRSMPLESVLENIKQLKNAGYREIVLTGIHFGMYGLDLSPKIGLHELLKRIHESKTMDRVRLSSIEPGELNDDVIKLVAESGVFCNHFHIPMQSGDDHILKKMHRPYTPESFRERVLKIADSVPEAAIGVDILAGFPGETDAAFENTYSLIKELPVTYLHVFPFSSRKGTLANTYPNKVPPKVIKARCRKLRELGKVKKKIFYEKLIGNEVEVLIEGKRSESKGLLKGITSNYVPVFVHGDDDLYNVMVQAKIERMNGPDSVFGSVC